MYLSDALCFIYILIYVIQRKQLGELKKKNKKLKHRDLVYIAKSSPKLFGFQADNNVLGRSGFYLFLFRVFLVAFL